MEGSGVLNGADTRHCREGVVTDVVFHDRRMELDRYEFMMREARGRLAVPMNAIILVGQHGVYCTRARDRDLPALDLQTVLKDINGAKELVGSVMES